MKSARKVALVTGGASGIGLAVVRAWAAQGHRVVLADIDSSAGAACAGVLAKAGADVRFAQADVASENSCRALFDGIAAIEGRLDLALNNAGVAGPAARVGDIDEDAWRRTLEVNLFGIYRCLAAELRVFAKQRSGCAVNVSSIYGKRGCPGGGAYAASKHAVLGLTRSAALEYGSRGIRVNAVCPGFIDTPFIGGDDAVIPRAAIDQLVQRSASRRRASPDEVAALVSWLSSDAASYVNGAALDVDGGFLAA